MFKFSTALISSLLLLSSSALALENNHLSRGFSHKMTTEIAQVDDLDPDTKQNILNFVKEITVKVTTSDNRGSGTLIAKKGNIYLVLTNAHVIKYGNRYTIQTYDGKIHQATLVNNPVPEDYDLALLQFSSEENYTVPSDDINIPTEESPVFSGGYSAESGEFITTEGQVTHTLSQSFKEGYSIGYTNNIKQGMSGGPIVNSQRSLVGINGRSAAPILNIGYIYPNGHKPTDAEIQEYRKVSWGIPIYTLLTYIKSDILTAYSLPVPDVVPTVETASYTSYTGWPGELEKKARQFTVKIDSSSEGNGSGVIIAKEGNIYTVLTVDHVFCGKKGGAIATTPCLEEYTYTITTHDGKTYPINKSTIIRQEGVDLAVFKFESSESYPVAEIANYYSNKSDYVFAAGFPKITNTPSKWFFSGGTVFSKERGLLSVRQSDFDTQQRGVYDKEQGTLQTRQSDFDKQQSGSLQRVASLTGGYELVYTSITYGGMSGGPVLDGAGRVIGIHGRAEGAAENNSIIHLGYSLGIPISTFVGLQDKFKVKPQLTTAKPQLSDQQQVEIYYAINDVKIPDTRATANIWIERGGQLWRLGKYDEAIKAFDEAIKQNDPDNVYLAWYGKGLALSGNEEQYQAAIEALQQAINTLPTEEDLKKNGS